MRARFAWWLVAIANRIYPDLVHELASDAVKAVRKDLAARALRYDREADATRDGVRKMQAAALAAAINDLGSASK